MDELVRWLGEQLDVDAAPIAMPNWHEPYCMEPSVEDGRCFYCGGEEDPNNVTYQARSPQWLREIEAKRGILAEHSPRDGRCRVCAAHAHDSWTRFRAPCATLRWLALPYAARPGYREEWAP